MFIPDFIFYNNILGITKIVRGDDLIDPTATDLEEHQKIMAQYLESVRQELIEEQERQMNEYLNSEKTE